MKLKNFPRFFKISGKKIPKSKSYVLMAVVVFLLIFSTAAYCSFCSIDLGEETDATVEETKTEDENNGTAQETKPEATEEVTIEETRSDDDTSETEEIGSPPAIDVIEVTDPSSDVVYDALATDVPSEWMNQLPTSHELQFHLEVSDPDNEDMVCMLSDSNDNNYEPIPDDSGDINFYWTSPEDAGELTMTFLIRDESGMETEKELNFTFIEY